MGIFSVELFEELEKLEPSVRRTFINILKGIEKSLGEVVKREDFLALKEVVERIGLRLEKLTERVEELAQAQKKTEERLNALAERVEELAQAQKKTEEELKKLAEGLRKTREDLDKLRKDFGGFTRSLSYAFENEAYRKLPSFLKERYNIEIFERFVRTEIQDQEINFFAKGRVEGREVYIIGETKFRLDENKKDFEKILEEIERKVRAVKAEFGEVEIVRLIVTHFARKRALKLAQEKGILVVQSFEW